MGDAQPLDAGKLTWAVLLGRWVAFARSAVALPEEGDDDAARLRQSVPDLIMLQAVWFALQHLDGLPADERALGVDRARVLVERHEQSLRRRFGAALPPALAELIADARGQLQQASRAS